MELPDITLLSLNADGLGDKIKRQAVFDKLKRKTKSGIFLLQETHTTPMVEKKWTDQWGNRNIIFGHGKSNSKGVAILFSNNLSYEVKKEFIDTEGRFIIVDIQIDKKIYTIANMYAPTRCKRQEQLDVLQCFIDSLNNFTLENTLIGGDFNLYLNQRLDKLDTMANTNDNPEYRNNILSFLESCDLVDIWRTLNPLKRLFTWHRGNARSRLDYFFTSEHFLNTVKSVEILPGFHSDHSLLMMNLCDSNEQNIGKGFWKFNSSLLNDTEYVNNIKLLIAECKEKYMDIADKRITWELVKMEIRSFTIPFCVKKKRDSLKLEASLNKRYNELYNIMQEGSASADIQQEFSTVENDIKEIERHKARGIILRSKCKWVEEGEKNTSYFLRLEKQNFCNKLISQLSVNDTIITDPKLILEEERRFYENLYNERIVDEDSFSKHCNEFTKQNNIPKLTDEDKAFCDSEIFESEILESLKALKNGKSPGSDGLTAEFYKFFWINIKSLLLDSFKYSIYYGELSIEQRRGIISLIPKKDKNRLYLKNWRPISLLNVDYKIMAKCLANRLCKVLPYLVNEDQTGYIKGRFIGCNIRIIEDTIIFTELNDLPGIVLTIDFEKAFDSISWKFLDKALEAFNFGIMFRKYIKLLYNNISTAVINNGDISSWFSPKRGVRQGCPISPYLFILAVELLAIRIRESKQIKGIDINGIEQKISQLADDTTCFVSDIDSVKETLDVFKSFSVCAGLNINIDKTTAKFIGSLRHRRDTPLGLDWSNPFVSCLGVKINGNESDHYELNYKGRILNLKNTLSMWKCRYLSLKGKVTVINNLALSPLLYLCSIIHTPENVISEIKSIVVDFLWDGKPSKIAYDILIQQIDAGGLKLMDIDSKVKALKTMWVKRFFDDSAMRWKATPSHFYKTHDFKQFFKYNIQPESVAHSKFYNDICKFWYETQNCVVSNASKEYVQQQIIWNNKFITMQRKPIIWTDWIWHGIITISDLLNDHGEFMSQVELNEKYHVGCNFLQVLQIRQSIPHEWRQVLYEIKTVMHRDMEMIFISQNKYNISKVNTNIFYNFFIEKKRREPTCIRKWTEEYPGFKDASEDLWPNIFRLPFNIIKDTYFQTFQYKIIHRLITCQKKLSEMKIADSPKCKFCNEDDTIRHFFLFCPKIDAFWFSFISWWNGLGGLHIPTGSECLQECILFGFQEKDVIFDTLNYCIIIAKYHIYCKRLHNDNNVDFYQYLIELKYRLKIEKTICSNSNTLKSFDKYMFIYEQI